MSQRIKIVYMRCAGCGMKSYKVPCLTPTHCPSCGRKRPQNGDIIRVIDVSWVEWWARRAVAILSKACHYMAPKEEPHA